jgi:hypothetical protein
MQGSTAKLRNVYGEVCKDKFEDVKPNDNSTEGSHIDANAHFVAVNKKIILGIMAHQWRWMRRSIRFHELFKN